MFIAEDGQDRERELARYAPSSRTSMMTKVERLFSVPAAAAAVEACSARISLDRDVADNRWRDPIVVIFWRRSIGMLI